MPVFRVEKNNGYTVMSNHHLRNKDLSLKAKASLFRNIRCQKNRIFSAFPNIHSLACNCTIHPQAISTIPA